MGCYATAFVLAPRLWSFVLSAARIWKHVVGTHTIFDKPVSCRSCQRCFVRCVLLNGCTSRVGSKGCFAAVFSVREVPALDVSVREPHLCSCASVSFLGVVQHLFFVLRYSLSSVTRFCATIRVGFRLQHISFNFFFLGHMFLPRRCI